MTRQICLLIWSATYFLRNFKTDTSLLGCSALWAGEGWRVQGRGVAGGSMSSLGIIVITQGAQWQGVVLCCRHAFSVCVTHGVSWGGPALSTTFLCWNADARACWWWLLTGRRGLICGPVPPPHARSLVTRLNKCATMLTGGPGHAPLSACACACLSPRPRNFPYVIYRYIADFTYGLLLGRPTEISLHTCAMVLTYWQKLAHTTPNWNIIDLVWMYFFFYNVQWQGFRLPNVMYCVTPKCMSSTGGFKLNIYLYEKNWISDARCR